MVLSPDDIAAITQIVASTIQGLQGGREGGGIQREKNHIDEKFFRKIPTFSGENWRDWSFQVKAATKSSSKDAGKLLDWAEEQVEDIKDYGAFAEDAGRAEQMSGYPLSRSSLSWRRESRCPAHLWVQRCGGLASSLVKR